MTQRQAALRADVTSSLLAVGNRQASILVHVCLCDEAAGDWGERHRGRPGDGIAVLRLALDSLADHFLPNQYDPADFALKLAHKDVALAAELGRDVDVPMRFIDLTRAELAEALNRGWGERDSRVALLLQQERAGVDIEVDNARLQDVLDRD